MELVPTSDNRKQEHADLEITNVTNDDVTEGSVKIYFRIVEERNRD